MVILPIAPDEFATGEVGSNQIEVFLRAHPDEAFALHEVEAAPICPQSNCRHHLDRWVVDPIVLGAQFYSEKRIECRVVGGTPYFRWRPAPTNE